MLSGEVAHRCREPIKEVCKANKVGILTGHLSKDHVHIFVSVPPYLRVRN
ncbi:MAG: transposase [Phaeodactylibacter sp.]|nr:transposase [Phaeodactylibacter sp.]MCB9053349.1 transposase [Lewinellaceae bacterium]